MRRALSLAVVIIAVPACSQIGGQVPGDADAHCGGRAVTIDRASCDGTDEPRDVGLTLFNSEGDDDDCKYHLRFTNTEVKLDRATTFTVVVTNKSDGKPAIGAGVRAEPLFDPVHAISGGNSVERPPGTYTVGPVLFDRVGRWTLRFRLHDDCVQSARSPRGQAAFYVDVFK